MRWFGGAFWFVLVIASGMTNFLVKQWVQDLDAQLAHVRRETADEQKKIHDLTAEWTMLNQPELLADLNNRYVHLAAVAPKQVVAGADSIALRPAPPKADADVAAAAPATPAAPAPAPVTAPGAAPAGPSHAPIVPVSATQVAHGPAQPAPAPARPAAPRTPVAAAPVAASLDALFAQVGSR